MMRRLAMLVVAAIAAVSLSACSLPRVVPQVSVSTVSFQAASDANQGYATRVDVVAVSTTALVETLSKETATNWFANKDQFLNANPGNVTVWSREVVPGRSAPQVSLNYFGRLDYDAIFVFAEYLTPGDHRAMLGQFENPVVLLQAQNFTVSGGQS
ncbi:hypothetical protein ACFOGJ_19720 [Marinibaculum pumilum]|uniref:Type VI secretion system protein n=1 Tax=Marinibaculum pumilum TaxID=1766165 RepID=A0ABV7L4A9_9PROT